MMMAKLTSGPQVSKRIYINPGEYRHGKGDGTVYVTVLGSCISVILWHPASQYFSFCHYLLASPAPGGRPVPEGKYGESVLPRMVGLAARRGIPVAETWVAVVGGAASDIYRTLSKRLLVGERNVRFANQFLTAQGFEVAFRDVGGKHGRKLSFNSATGEIQVVDVSQGAPDAADH